MANIKKIVCIGGGTGVSTVLFGLKKYPVELSAIISVFDDGGSSGKLREKLGVLPPGDARQCIDALAGRDDALDLFHYRFETGELKGHNLGNLLISAAERICGNFEQAIDKIGKVIKMKGKVLPITLAQAKLKAGLNNNKIISGEDAIVKCSQLSKIGLKKLFLEPEAEANPSAILAIKKADLIIIGPGKFYTSIIPNFLVKGIIEALRKSVAKKVFICNLMTQEGNTDGFLVEDFVKSLEDYLGKKTLNYIVFNTKKLAPALLKKTKEFFPKAEFVGFNKNLPGKERFIGRDVLDKRIYKLNPSDTLVTGANQRTILRHDPDKLAAIIMQIMQTPQVK